MQLYVESWPRYSDQIRIETWPSGIEGIYAFREFEIFVNDIKIGSASTAWLVFKLSSRRLIKIPPEFADKIPGSQEEPTIELKRKFSDLTTPGPVLNVKVAWPHLDLNNHTNNVHYYSWMMMAPSPAR